MTRQIIAPAETNAAQDLADRWAPSESQILAARALLSHYPADHHVAVPIVLVGKTPSIWTTDVVVEHVPGVLVLGVNDREGIGAALAYHEANDVALSVARSFLGQRTGTASYATITRDGWAVWEDWQA